jgi:acyl carrier protein
MQETMQEVKYDIDPAVLRAWMTQYICGVVGLDPAKFSTRDRFDVYGLDSFEAVIMAGMMENEFQVTVEPEQFFEAPSVDAFVAAFTNATPVV